MLINLIKLQQHISPLLLVFCRTSSFFIIFPLFSRNYISPRIVLVLSLFLSIVIYGYVSQPVGFSVFSVTMLSTAITQMILGASAGFVFNIVFDIFLMAGQIVALQSGLGFANMVEPGLGSMNIIGRIYWIAGVLIFLMLDGHLLFVNLITQSFQTIPISTSSLLAINFQSIIAYSAQLFVNAVAVTMPIIIALLAINLLFAMMTRAAPQFNIFSVGFPITLVLGLIIVMLTFHGFTQYSKHIFDQAFLEIATLLKK